MKQNQRRKSVNETLSNSAAKKNELEVSEIRKRPSLRAGWLAAYQSYPAITWVPSPTSKTVRREITATEATAAVASRRQEQQQLMGSCRFPLYANSYQPLSLAFCGTHRSLSLSSSRFLSACRRGEA